MLEPPPLPPPWCVPTVERARDLEAQLVQEVPRKHPLYGAHATVDAVCGECDELLVTLGDGGRAIIGLSWSWRPPRVLRPAGPASTAAALRSHAARHGSGPW